MIYPMKSRRIWNSSLTEEKLKARMGIRCKVEKVQIESRKGINRKDIVRVKIGTSELSSCT